MTPDRIRIAQLGWNGDRPAGSWDDTRIGVMVPWVELDGVRHENVSDVTVESGGDKFTTVTLTLFGRVEYAYLDADGREILPWQWRLARTANRWRARARLAWAVLRAATR